MAQCGMAYARKSTPRCSTDQAMARGSELPMTVDPRAFGLTKAAYAVGEALDLLSIGRTSLYAAVKRGDLKRVKFGRKMLFYAADLAAFLTKCSRGVEPGVHRAGDAPNASKSTEHS